ncbi:hypothetical protein M422DRAFT_260810 [Sphaerobolus stellatus SS14]|uniref:Uncharacterized protein n=1 Tax=Sphaerobolus stellatus (strain SS14) TaxID=990650 RepID=A0A0C9V4U1_SPHS4|nr:hypothetical protein M422DRAFT_260810 [Sphaerobolus stellatus SS14]
MEALIRIRQEMPSNFIIGIKLNAGDYTTGDMTEDATMGHIRRLCGLSIDFIEIVVRTMKILSAIACFSRKVMQERSTVAWPLILLTGGLRIPSQLSGAILNNHTRDWAAVQAYQHITFPDSNLHAHRWTPELTGAGVGVAWYTVGLRSLAEGKALDMRMGT